MTNHATQIVMQAASEMADRAKTYDNEAGERSMDATVTAFESVTGHSITVEQGWLFMALLKAVRSQQGAYREDSYVDGAAYFGLAGEAACQARNGGWTPEAIDAAKLPDWDAAENRMDAIGQNGATGEHYLHPLTDYIHSAPSWASRVHQPAGASNIYAQNDDGRSALIKSGVSAWHDHRTLELPPLRRMVCVNNDEAAGQLTLNGCYVTRSPAGEIVCFVTGDDGELCAFASHRFIEEAY